jgi:hypothetical protein
MSTGEVAQATVTLPCCGPRCTLYKFRGLAGGKMNDKTIADACPESERREPYVMPTIISVHGTFAAGAEDGE